MKKWLLLLALVVSAHTNAAVYSFTHLVGSGSASGSITTDGTVGSLTASNILDWNIFLDGNPGDTFTLLGPLSGNNSSVLYSGTGFSATTTDLLFNFSNSGFLLFQNPFIGSSRNYLCFAGSLCGNFSNAINIATSVFGVNTSPMTGEQIIASAQMSNAPLPSAVSLFGLGLGVMGLIKRRRA